MMLDGERLTRDAEERYGHAWERMLLVRQAWEDAGRPLLCLGSQGQQVEHALLKTLRAAEEHALRMAAPLRPARMGRPPEAVLGGAFARSPSSRLRSVRTPKA